MSPTAVRAVQRTCQVQFQPSCLPFLYYTRTILQHRPRTPRGADNREKACRSSSSQAGRGFHSSGTRAYIPFEGQGPSDSDSKLYQPFSNDAEGRAGKASTLTASERAVFSQIFENVPQRSRKGILAFEEDEAEDMKDPYEDMNAIFDNALDEEKEREKSRSAITENPNPRTKTRRGIPRALDFDPRQEDRTRWIYRNNLVRPLKIVDGQVVNKLQALKLEEQVAAACKDHRIVITRMLENSTTDLEIWNLLGKEVFGMMTQLTLQISLEEAATSSKANAKPRKIGRPKKSTDPPPSIHSAFTSFLDDSNLLPTDTLLSILRESYAYYNVLAARLWRRRFPKTNYMSLLLPHIKSLGPISYVLGASTSLYNEVLFMKWYQYNDLHGIADLLEEMVNQGVEHNLATLRLLKTIKNIRRVCLAGESGQLMQSWWNLRPVSEAWDRVNALYLQFVAKEREARSKAAQEEAREEEEVEEEDTEATVELAKRERGDMAAYTERRRQATMVKKRLLLKRGQRWKGMGGPTFRKHNVEWEVYRRMPSESRAMEDKGSSRRGEEGVVRKMDTEAMRAEV